MYLILAKFRYDWVKIVDFLIKGHFWSSPHWADQVCIGQGSPPTLEFWRNIFKVMGLGLQLCKYEYIFVVITCSLNTINYLIFQRGLYGNKSLLKYMRTSYVIRYYVTSGFRYLSNWLDNPQSITNLLFANHGASWYRIKFIKAIET